MGCRGVRHLPITQGVGVSGRESSPDHSPSRNDVGIRDRSYGRTSSDVVRASWVAVSAAVVVVVAMSRFERQTLLKHLLTKFISDT